MHTILAKRNAYTVTVTKTKINKYYTDRILINPKMGIGETQFNKTPKIGV